MRSAPRAWFAGSFICFATLAVFLLVLRPSAAWSVPTAVAPPTAQSAPTLRCDSPWDRMTASPSALIRSTDESAFPADHCGAAIASRQELASGAALLAAVSALLFAATILPRARRRPGRTVGGVRPARSDAEAGLLGRFSWR